MIKYIVCVICLTGSSVSSFRTWMTIWSHFNSRLCRSAEKTVLNKLVSGAVNVALQRPWWLKTPQATFMQDKYIFSSSLTLYLFLFWQDNKCVWACVCSYTFTLMRSRCLHICIEQWGEAVKVKTSKTFAKKQALEATVVSGYSLKNSGHIFVFRLHTNTHTHIPRIYRSK